MTRDRLLEQALELLAIADFHSLTLKEERNQVVREGIELLRQPKPDQDELTLISDQTLHDTTPPQRTWVGLTEQEHTDIAVECGCMSADWVFYGAAVERKVKERNT